MTETICIFSFYSCYEYLFTRILRRSTERCSVLLRNLIFFPFVDVYAKLSLWNIKEFSRSFVTVQASYKACASGFGPQKNTPILVLL